MATSIAVAEFSQSPKTIATIIEAKRAITEGIQVFLICVLMTTPPLPSLYYIHRMYVLFEQRIVQLDIAHKIPTTKFKKFITSIFIALLKTVLETLPATNPGVS
tara:strand:- start:485 stop:796 length:312 start_codon:yes stop_codon:yes gene_type:complete